MDYDHQDLVRYIGAMRTDVPGTIVGMFVADNICHLFSKITSGGTDNVSWYQFVCNSTTLGNHVETKASSESEYIFSPDLV